VRRAYLLHVPIVLKSVSPVVLKSVSLNLLEPSGPVQACNGIALPLPLPLPLRGENRKEKILQIKAKQQTFQPR